MSFVQIGKRKINTTLICFAEEDNGVVRLWFTGQPTVLEFDGDAGIAMWKAIKADAVLGAADEKGFRMAAKKPDTKGYEMGHEKPLVVEKPVMNTPKPASIASPPQPARR